MISPKPAVRGAHPLPNEPAAMPPPVLGTCAVRARPFGVNARVDPSRRYEVRCNNRDHSQALDTWADKPAVMCSSQRPAHGMF